MTTPDVQEAASALAAKAARAARNTTNPDLRDIFIGVAVQAGRIATGPVDHGDAARGLIESARQLVALVTAPEED